MSASTLALFLFIAAIILIIRLVARLFRKKEPLASASHRPPPFSAVPDRPVGFGYKCTWLAVKGIDQASIAHELGLRAGVPCNWKTGNERAYQGADVFMTPPVDGWTLLVGWGGSAMDDQKGLEHAKAVLAKLSTRFDEAQFFGTHRVVEYHAWMRATKGTVIRAYAYLGERGENLIAEGASDPSVEPDDLINTFSEEARDPGYPERDDLAIPDEDMVMKIAGAWSVDPTSLDERQDLPAGAGLLFRVA